MGVVSLLLSLSLFFLYRIYKKKSLSKIFQIKSCEECERERERVKIKENEIKSQNSYIERR